MTNPPTYWLLGAVAGIIAGICITLWPGWGLIPGIGVSLVSSGIGCYLYIRDIRRDL